MIVYVKHFSCVGSLIPVWKASKTSFVKIGTHFCFFYPNSASSFQLQIYRCPFIIKSTKSAFPRFLYFPERFVISSNKNVLVFFIFSMFFGTAVNVFIRSYTFKCCFTNSFKFFFSLTFDLWANVFAIDAQRSSIVKIAGFSYQNLPRTFSLS